MRLAVWVPPAGEDDEGAAAIVWAQERGLAPASLAPSVLEERECVVAWIHAGSAVPVLSPGLQRSLGAWVADGGILACTLLATPLAQDAGAPGPSPLVSLPQRWKDDDDPRWPAAFREWPDYPHLRGLQAYGDHPLFDGLQRGAFTWMACEGDVVAGTHYRRPRWAEGGVIAVDRSYVHLDADFAVAWEYRVGAGSVRCVGSHLCLTSGNPLLRPHRDLVLANLLRPDWGPTDRRSWWPTAPARHAPVTVVPRPVVIAPLPGQLSFTPVAVSQPPGEDPVTLGSPHGLMTGTEAGGVRELWLHPLCVIDAGIEVGCDAGPLQADRAECSPAHFRRSLVTPAGLRWRETVVASTAEPAWWHELAPESGGDAAIGVEFSVPLRLAWPMPPEGLQPLRTEVRRDGERATVLVSGCDGRHRVAIHLDGVADVDVDAGDAAPRVRAVSAPGDGLRIGVHGLGGLWRTPREGAAPTSAIRGQKERLDALAARCISWESADSQLDLAIRWSRARLANFVTGTLDGRRGMVAGYAPTRPGWNRSRPGYAWFFGRDTCWCVDALLALGLFEEARDAIDLLAGTMDITGKVAHEVSMSGVVHYDAADATPLFLRAVGLYEAWTGDVATVERWWPAVDRAFAFVRDCDRDGDGLPENTGVGHGWIEMGPLGGGAVTSYVAACWIDALQQLEPAAGRVGPSMCDAIGSALAAARAGLEGLRLPDGRLALHRDRAGRLEPELTALAAVPIALGVDDSPAVLAQLDALADESFTTPWGVRLLSAGSPHYRPGAYHGGTVWPLFTGWVVLADARLGRLDRALERIKTVAGCIHRGSRGAFDEALDGNTGAEAGVCPDQAWSAAALVTPLMHGVLGLRAGAADGLCALAPALPRGLGRVAVKGLRVGATRWSAWWEAGRGVSLEHLGGPHLQVRVGDHAGIPSRIGPDAPRASSVGPGAGR